MNRIWLFTFVMLFSVVPLTANATTRYVSPSGSGSTCSLGSPCSVGTGMSQTGQSDTLYFLAGTYDTNLTTWTNGTSVAYTRYAKEPSALQGSAIILPTNNQSTLYMDASHQYIEIDGLVFDGTNNSVNLNNVRLDGPLYIRIKNSEIRNSAMGSGTICPSGSPEQGGNGISGGGQSEFLNNRVHHNRCYAFYSGTTNDIFDGNILHDNGQYGFHLYNSNGFGVHDNIVRNNIIYNNGFFGQYEAGAILLQGGTNNIVYNNVVYNNAQGIVIDTTNTKVYGNTVYGSSGANYGYCIGVTAGASGIEMKNNICYQNNRNTPADGGGAGNCTGSTCSNNLTSNPGFVSIAGGDFHILAAGSPAVNAGATLGAPYNVDQEGSTRPSGQYTIGAYQFGGAPPSTIGTIAKYTFEEGTGTTAADSSGNPSGPHNCTLNSAGWSTGIIGSFALNANGARECHVTTTADMRPTTTMGIAVWFNGGTPPGYGYVVDVGGAFGLWHDPAGILYGYINTSSGIVGVQSTGSVLTNTNQFAALTKDSTGLRLWVGTSQVGFTATTASISYTGSEVLYIARNGVNNQEYFTGIIDQVRLFDTALDQAAVNSLFTESPLGSAGISVTHMRYFGDVAAEGIPLNNVNLDTNGSAVLGQKFGIRFAIHNQGSTITEYFPLWCSRNGGAFTKISGSFGSFGLRIATSTFVNMGDLTAAILPLDGFAGISGRFVADVINTAITTALASGQHTEWEYRVESGTPAVAGDTYVCEPRRQADTVFDTYNNQLKTLALVGITAPSGVRVGGGYQGGVFK